MYQGWGQVQLTKYSSTSTGQVLRFLKKYLSTSSTFISSTSTSTHIRIGSKVRMDIQSRVNFGWTKQKPRAFPKSCIGSKVNLDGHILSRADFRWTK